MDPFIVLNLESEEELRNTFSSLILLVSYIWNHILES